MTTKILIFLGAVVVVTLLILWGGQDGGKDTVRAPVSQKPKTLQTPHGNVVIDLPLPSIERAHLAVQGPDGDDMGKIWLKPNQPVALPGTDQSVELVEFYTHWNWNKRPVNLSYNEKNPAVGIHIMQGDSILSHQWAFRDMPFFRSGQGTGHPGSSSGQLAFTLLAYEGVTIPVQPANEEKHYEST